MFDLQAMYWRNSKGGPKKFVAVLLDGSTVPYDLTTQEGWETAKDLNGPAIGVITLIPADGKWGGRFAATPLTNGYMSEKADDPNELVPLVYARYQEAAEAWLKIITDPVAHLEFMLQRHDWYYSYSDDFGVWNAGEANMKRILARCDDVPNAQELWEKHAPKDFPYPKAA